MKGGKYGRRRLTFSDRILISNLLLQKKTAKDIAQELEKCEATILEELERGGGRSNYDAEKAQKQASVGRFKQANRDAPSEEEIKQIQDMRRSGVTIRKIREFTRRGNETVQLILKGIPAAKVKVDTRSTLEKKLDAMQQQIDILFELIKEGQK